MRSAFKVLAIEVAVLLAFAAAVSCGARVHPASRPHPFRDAPAVLVCAPVDGTTVNTGSP